MPAPPTRSRPRPCSATGTPPAPPPPPASTSPAPNAATPRASSWRHLSSGPEAPNLPLHLARLRMLELRHEAQLARDLVDGQALAAVRDQLVLGRLAARIRRHDLRDGDLAEPRVLARGHAALAHRRVLREHLLDLLREELHARHVDAALAPAGQEQRAVGVEPALVAGAEAVGLDERGGRRPRREVRVEQARPADAHLAGELGIAAAFEPLALVAPQPHV